MQTDSLLPELIAQDACDPSNVRQSFGIGTKPDAHAVLAPFGINAHRIRRPRRAALGLRRLKRFRVRVCFRAIVVRCRMHYRA
ncbi:hypothetical protein GQ57_33940 [Burkholderia sp. MSh2]|nr:hypothetical protein GQ57_33940 [Burkholderia sp. MSh2]KFG97861.1 hypothetical protein GQ56_0108230 [Burkholderia paludis]